MGTAPCVVETSGSSTAPVYPLAASGRKRDGIRAPAAGAIPRYRPGRNRLFRQHLRVLPRRVRGDAPRGRAPPRRAHPLPGTDPPPRPRGGRFQETFSPRETRGRAYRGGEALGSEHAARLRAPGRRRRPARHLLYGARGGGSRHRSLDGALAATARGARTSPGLKGPEQGDAVEL